MACGLDDTVLGGGAGGVAELAKGGDFSRSFNEACSMSETFCRPFRVSSKVAVAARLDVTGSDSFLLGLIFFSALPFSDMGYFQ